MLRTGSFWQAPLQLAFAVLLVLMTLGQGSSLISSDSISCDRRSDRCVSRSSESIRMSDVEKAFVHSVGGDLGMHWVELDTADGEIQISDGTTFSQGVKREYADAITAALRDSRLSHFELERSRGFFEVPATAFLSLAFGLLAFGCLVIPFRRTWLFQLRTGTLEIRAAGFVGVRVESVVFEGIELGPLAPGIGWPNGPDNSWWCFPLEFPGEKLEFCVRGEQGQTVYQTLAYVLSAPAPRVA